MTRLRGFIRRERPRSRRCGQRETMTVATATRGKESRGMGPHPCRTPLTMTDLIRDSQGVGSIIALVLVLGRDSVQKPSLRMMYGMDSFLRRLRQELNRGVGEEETGGERNNNRDENDVGNGDGVGDG